MNEVWTIGEQHNGQIKDVSYELLARGRELADKLNTKLVSVLIGNKVSKEKLNELIYRGADIVYYIDSYRLENFTTETYSNILAELIEERKPQIIIAAATTMGRTLMPYVAIKVDTGLTADCTELNIEEGTNNLLQIRPAIGGNIMATIKTPDNRPQMATVRPKSCHINPIDKSREGEIFVEDLKEKHIDNRVVVKELKIQEKEETNIQEAAMIVASGRGVKKQSNLELLRELARTINASIGASRDVVDRGWLSYPHQVGLSGKTVSPKLYIAVGISGSIQHLAGIKTAETVVAINNDPNASIFKVSDYGIVGDLFEVIPILNKKLAALKGEG